MWSIQHHWIFLSGHCVFFCLRVLVLKFHYYCAELQLEKGGDKTQPTLLPRPTYPGILFIVCPWYKLVFLSARCTSSEAVCQHLNSTHCITLGKLAIYLFLRFLICKTGKMVGPIQLKSVKYSCKRRMPLGISQLQSLRAQSPRLSSFLTSIASSGSSQNQPQVW